MAFMLSMSDTPGAPPGCIDADDGRDYDDMSMDLDDMFKTDRQRKAAPKIDSTNSKSSNLQGAVGSTSKTSGNGHIPHPPTQPPQSKPQLNARVSTPNPQLLKTHHHPDTESTRSQHHVSHGQSDGFDWSGFGQMSELQEVNGALLKEVDNLKLKLKAAQMQQNHKDANSVTGK